MSKTKTEYELELVEWIDHSTYEVNEWRLIEEIASDLTPQEIHTVGWVIGEDKNKIILVSSKHLRGVDDDNAPRACGEICILKSAILKRTPLVVPEAPDAAS